MIVIPAVDIKDGKCVRLRQGRADDVTVYADDPAEMARHWVDQGASLLHVVDLDGAFGGTPVHVDTIADIASRIKIPVQVGGGIRNNEDIQRYLDAGVYRVVLGTRACQSPDQMAGLATEFGARLAVSIDARDGLVQVKGWVETTNQTATALAAEMERAGITTLIYTDTSRDGMMQGPNLDAIGALCDAASCDVIASGGVTELGDIHALRRLSKRNLAGVIVGKALYEGSVDLRSAVT